MTQFIDTNEIFEVEQTTKNGAAYPSVWDFHMGECDYCWWCSGWDSKMLYTKISQCGGNGEMFCSKKCLKGQHQELYRMALNEWVDETDENPMEWVNGDPIRIEVYAQSKLYYIEHPPYSRASDDDEPDYCEDCDGLINGDPAANDWMNVRCSC